MNIAGINTNSFVDMEGMIAYVVFTQGCNLDCWYCHNRHILGNVSNKMFHEKQIIEDIKKRKGFIDIVVVSGGEPTLQPDLVDFIQKINDLGILVKLDTNGTNPNVVKELLDKNLLHSISMDIKSPLKKYEDIANCKVKKDNILKSIELIRNSGLNYEFRTTFSPDLDKEDIINIAKYIKGCPRYSLQQFIPHENITKKYFAPHSKDYIQKTAEEIKKYVNVKLKGISVD